MDILMQWSVDNILKISAVKLIFEVSTLGAVFKQRQTEGLTSGRTLKICSNNSICSPFIKFVVIVLCEYNFFPLKRKLDKHLTNETKTPLPRQICDRV